MVDSSNYTFDGKNDEVLEGIINHLKRENKLADFDGAMIGKKIIGIYYSQYSYSFDTTQRYYDVISILYFKQDNHGIFMIEFKDESVNFRDSKSFRIVDDIKLPSNWVKVLKGLKKKLKEFHSRDRWYYKENWNTIYHLPSKKEMTMTKDIFKLEPIRIIDWELVRKKVGALRGFKKEIIQKLIANYPESVVFHRFDNEKLYSWATNLESTGIIENLIGTNWMSNEKEMVFTDLGMQFVNKFMNADLKNDSQIFDDAWDEFGW